MHKPLAAFGAAVALAALGLGALGCEDEKPSPAALPTASASAAVASAAPVVSAAPVASAAPSAVAPVEVAAAASASAAPTAKPVSAPSAAPKASAALVADAGAPGALDAGAASGASSDAGSASDASAAIAPPAPGSADAVAVKVDAVYLPQKTYQAKFEQQYTPKISGVTKKSTGTLFAERPNKISFRYDAPNANRVVSDGTTIQIYDAEAQQLTKHPVGSSEFPGLLGFFMGKGLGASFTFAFNDQAKFAGGPVLLGKPRTPSGFYETVLFYIDDALLAKSDAGTVRRVVIVDAQGNKNRFDFTAATSPASIAPSEFTFTPPAGTTVRDMP